MAIVVPRPTCRQHLCADTAYDARQTRHFLTAERYQVHIPHRRQPQQPAPVLIPHPGYAPRHWVVERTFAWFVKCRSLRTRWTKYAHNWLAFFHLAAAHFLFNMTFSG